MKSTLNRKSTQTNKLKSLYLFIGLLFLTSCKNYYISLESLKQQFADAKSSQMKRVTMAGGGTLLTRQEYEIVPIEKIKCTDKKGIPQELVNSPAIEMRISYVAKGKRKKRRTVLYFDTIRVTDSTITGYRSRILGMPKTIPIDSIKKIEVQNGGKNFHYVKK